MGTPLLMGAGKFLSAPVPNMIGNFIDSSDVTKGDVFNSANYTQAGGITATFSSNSIHLTGTNTGNFSQYLLYNYWVSDRENLVWEETFTVNNIVARSYGYAIELTSPYTRQVYTYALGFDSATNNNGSIYTFKGNVLQNIQTRIMGAQNNGDVIKFTLSRTNAMTLSFSVTNITQGVTKSAPDINFNFNPPFANILPVAFKFKSVLFGADITITNRKISTTDYDYPDQIYCFDSKGQGYFSGGTTTANRFSSLVAANYPTKRIINLSGANETLTDLHSRINEVLSYKSYVGKKCRVYLGVNSNDVRNGTFNATTKGYLISDFNALSAANFDPYVCYMMPEQSLDATPYNTWVAGEPTFSGKTIPETFSVLWSGSSYTPNPAYMAADGYHPNAAGNAQLATITQFNTFN